MAAALQRICFPALAEEPPDICSCSTSSSAVLDAVDTPECRFALLGLCVDTLPLCDVVVQTMQGSTDSPEELVDLVDEDCFGLVIVPIVTTLGGPSIEDGWDAEVAEDYRALIAGIVDESLDHVTAPQVFAVTPPATAQSVPMRPAGNMPPSSPATTRALLAGSLPAALSFRAFELQTRHVYTLTTVREPKSVPSYSLRSVLQDRSISQDNDGSGSTTRALQVKVTVRTDKPDNVTSLFDDAVEDGTLVQELAELGLTLLAPLPQASGPGIGGNQESGVGSEQQAG